MGKTIFRRHQRNERHPTICKNLGRSQHVAQSSQINLCRLNSYLPIIGPPGLVIVRHTIKQNSCLESLVQLRIKIHSPRLQLDLTLLY